jgi:hypothetical protein
MQLQIGLSLILVISVTSAIYGIQGDSSAEDLLTQFTRSNELILTTEKISQLEGRLAKIKGATEKDYIQKMLEEEKQNFYIQNKMMRIEKVRHDSAEEDELYDAVSSAWKEYVHSEAPTQSVQAGVRDGVKNLNAYYYSQMSSHMSQVRERAQKKDAVVFGSLMIQAMLAGFVALGLKKPKKKVPHFTVIPISAPKKKTEDSSKKAA